MTRTLLAIALAAGAVMPLLSQTTARISVMLLDGESGGPYHDWPRVTPVLKKMLDETGLFATTVVTAPPATGDFSRFAPAVRQLPGGRDELRRAGRTLAGGAQDVVRGLHAKRRRARVGACRRQRVSRLAGVQRDDRRRRLARAHRDVGAVLVLSATASSPPTGAWLRRQPRPAHAVSGDRARRDASDHARAAAACGCTRATSCTRACAVPAAT